MFFLMRCLHHPGKDADRDAHRAAHRDWVGTGGGGLASALVGSALWDEAGARAFAEGDPFARAGIVREIDLTRLADGVQAHRITERMTQE